MTEPTYPLSTPLARLFLALAETLGDPEVSTDLKPVWEIKPGISTFSLTAQRRARSQLAALDPADLHYRILAQGVAESALSEVLTHFRLPLTGTPGESRETGWTVCYEDFSDDLGFLVWAIYSPLPDREDAIHRFRRLFFPEQPDSETFCEAVIVLPGRFLHPGAAPGQGKELEIMSSGTSAPVVPVPGHQPTGADTPTLPPEAALLSLFTHRTNLDLLPSDPQRSFTAEVPLPPPALYLETLSARLFVDLAGTLGDQNLLAALAPQLEVWPGMSCFQIPAYVEAQARLAMLEPEELHRRILAQGIALENLIEVLLTFHFPMTEVVADTPGFTVFIDYGEMGVGRRVWLQYSPDLDEEGAVNTFRQTFFPDEEEWSGYGALKRVVPGHYLHSLAPPGREDEFFEHLSA